MVLSFVVVTFGRIYIYGYISFWKDIYADISFGRIDMQIYHLGGYIYADISFGRIYIYADISFGRIYICRYIIWEDIYMQIYHLGGYIYICRYIIWEDIYICRYIIWADIYADISFGRIYAVACLLDFLDFSYSVFAFLENIFIAWNEDISMRAGIWKTKDLPRLS